MEYFFILGNNPGLSVAEISSRFPGAKLSLASAEVLLLKSDSELAPVSLIQSLGGTIKLGQIKTVLRHAKLNNIVETFSELTPENVAGKYLFGISIYGAPGINLKVLGMETKKILKTKGIASRWVMSREKTLSSVVVTQNKLIDKGNEFVVINQGGKLLVGQTEAVQPFKELSYRDYGRPSRDDRSGMLPPKLAQIMINLSQAGKNDILLDPFCGSGTILSEAALMGHQNLIGTDNSEKAINDTRHNVAWIEKKFEIKSSRLKIYQTDATAITKSIAPTSINAIITEPYLGPQRGRLDADKIIGELNELYSKALKEFKKILKPEGRVVMIWPRFKVVGNTRYLTPNLSGFKIINPLPVSLQYGKFIKLTDRNTIVYGRPGQRVWREIVILKKS